MKDIYVLHARDIEKASPVVAGRPFRWLYLGQDIKQRDSISQVLGKENRYFIGDSLQQVAYQQKQPFLNLIADLGLHQKNRVYWWASNIAYKNPFLAHGLFLILCYDGLFEKICSERKQGEEGQFLVFVEDRWLYRYLWENYQKNGSDIRFLSRKSVIPETLKLVIRGIVGRAYVLSQAAYHVWQSRRIAPKIGTTGAEKDGRQIYVYSWVQDRFFGDTGEFNDAYFGRLPEILTDNGLKVAFITPPSLSPVLKRKCLSYGKYKYTFLDQYINYSDILKCLLTPFRISYGATQRRLRILLLRQAVYEISMVPGHMLYYFAFKRWLKEIGRRETTIIYPFENQPWEKMLCMAAKESGKKIKLVGYQHSVVASLILNYFPGARESSNMPLPDTIVTSGEHSLELLKRAGYGKVELINGGALRYEHLHEMGEERKQTGKPKTVLIALPYIANLAEEMLLATSNSLGDLKEKGIRIIIKTHPVGPSKHLATQTSTWPVHFQQTDKPIPEIMLDTDLLIYTSSAIGLEAHLAGVPVIKYLSEHFIDSDVLEADGASVRICFENNMKDVVLAALNEKSHGSAGQQIRSLDWVFSPVNEDVWKQVVEH